MLWRSPKRLEQMNSASRDRDHPHCWTITDARRVTCTTVTHSCRNCPSLSLTTRERVSLRAIAWVSATLPKTRSLSHPMLQHFSKMLKPHGQRISLGTRLTWVGVMVVMSSSESFFRIVVFPALSRPRTSILACSNWDAMKAPFGCMAKKGSWVPHWGHLVRIPIP